MTYLLETYGCQMNKAESAALEIILHERNWTCTQNPEEADMVLINTCSVRAGAETRAWARIDLYASIKKTKGKPHIIVTGCMAEQHKKTMQSRQTAIDYVLGSFQKQAFGLILDSLESGKLLDCVEEEPQFVFASSHHQPGSFRALVPIMHGCNNFCSFCIVPYVRGREISRSPDSILQELAKVAASGVVEVSLLGQNVNSYAWDGGRGVMDFPELVKNIAEYCNKNQLGIKWLRFLSSHPKDLDDKLIELLAQEKLLCKHVHLCLQSGDDTILAAMNRKYSTQYFLNLTEKMKKSIPGLSLSTDILVGFPGETEAAFENTLQVMREVGFLYSFMYYYNPREGTKAATFGNQVPKSVKLERLARVIEEQKKLSKQQMESRIGKTELVLIEGVSKKSKTQVVARTQRDESLVFTASANRQGQFATVRLQTVQGTTFQAQEVVS